MEPPLCRTLQRLASACMPHAPLLLSCLPGCTRNSDRRLPVGGKRKPLHPNSHHGHDPMHHCRSDAEVRHQPSPIRTLPSGTLDGMGHQPAPDNDHGLLPQHGHTKVKQDHFHGKRYGNQRRLRPQEGQSSCRLSFFSDRTPSDWKLWLTLRREMETPLRKTKTPTKHSTL